LSDLTVQQSSSWPVRTGPAPGSKFEIPLDTVRCSKFAGVSGVHRSWKLDLTHADDRRALENDSKARMMAEGNRLLDAQLTNVKSISFAGHFPPGHAINLSPRPSPTNVVQVGVRGATVFGDQGEKEVAGSRHYGFCCAEIAQQNHACGAIEVRALSLFPIRLLLGKKEP